MNLSAIRQAGSGHVKWLIDKGVKYLLSSIPYERKEISGANNHYNCPIVTYPENIKTMWRSLEILLLNLPIIFYPLDEKIHKRLVKIFTEKGIDKDEIKDACKGALEELANAGDDIRKKGEETLAYLRISGRRESFLQADRTI